MLNGLREEVEALEGEIQRVEGELLGDPDDKVLNRKFERLAEEKRNKEARRERLELHLTSTLSRPSPDLKPQLWPCTPIDDARISLAAVPDNVYAQTSQAGQGLMPGPQELHLSPQQHPYYHVPHAGIKRSREDGQPDFHNPSMPPVSGQPVLQQLLVDFIHHCA